MANDFTILAGSVSQALWISRDGGDNWLQWHGHGVVKPRTATDFEGMWLPFNLEGQVRALAVDPKNDSVIYAGDELGVLKSADRGKTWRRLNGPFTGFDFWALTVDPVDSNVVYAGSRPAVVFRSQDGGETWHRMGTPFPARCTIGPTRVVSIKVDPDDNRRVWAGAEKSGLARSLDGGDTWAWAGGNVVQPGEDVHDVQIVPGTQVRPNHGHASLERGRGSSVVVVAMSQVTASSDQGEDFHLMIKSVELGQNYSRLITYKPDDPMTIFLTKGGLNSAYGEIYKSTDGGASWKECPLPEKPTSGFFGIATHPSNPNRLVASTLYGEFFVSEDAGESWVRLKQKVNEIRALAWVPNN